MSVIDTLIRNKALIVLFPSDGRTKGLLCVGTDGDSEERERRPRGASLQTFKNTSIFIDTVTNTHFSSYCSLRSRVLKCGFLSVVCHF